MNKRTNNVNAILEGLDGLKIVEGTVDKLENGKTYTLLKDLPYVTLKDYKEYYEESLEFPKNFLRKYIKGNSIVFKKGTKVRYYADMSGDIFIIDGEDVPFNTLEETLEDMGETISSMFKG